MKTAKLLSVNDLACKSRDDLIELVLELEYELCEAKALLSGAVGEEETEKGRITAAIHRKRMRGKLGAVACYDLLQENVFKIVPYEALLEAIAKANPDLPRYEARKELHRVHVAIGALRSILPSNQRIENASRKGYRLISGKTWEGFPE